jgi:integrase
MRYHEGLRAETIRRQRTDLLTFAQFLASIGVQSGDFYHDLSAWQGIRACLLEAFIEWQNREGYSMRDAMLMCLLLDHGLRVGEVVILKRNQIHLRGRTLTFYRPKVDEPQTDRLTDDTYEAARAYLPTLPAKQESLFDLAIISIQERVRTLGELVGIHGLSPHDCRHS